MNGCMQVKSIIYVSVSQDKLAPDSWQVFEFLSGSTCKDASEVFRYSCTCGLSMNCIGYKQGYIEMVCKPEIIVVFHAGWWLFSQWQYCCLEMLHQHTCNSHSYGESNSDFHKTWQEGFIWFLTYSSVLRIKMLIRVWLDFPTHETLT